MSKKTTVKNSHCLRNTLVILAVCIVVGLSLTAILFSRENGRTSVSARLTFSFDGAQNGIAPNGYTFDANDLTSEEVVSAALAEAGMADRYEVDTIRANLFVQGVYPDDLVDRMKSYNSLTSAGQEQTLTLKEFHPTVFTVTLYQDFAPSAPGEEMTSLLEAILKVYRTEFTKKYSVSMFASPATQDRDFYDYFQQLELIRFELEQVGAYADELAEKDSAFMVNGKGFSDLSLQFATMAETDLNRINATITMNGLSKNLDRLRDQYKMEIEELKKKVAIREKLVEKLDKLITVYGKNGVIYYSTGEAMNQVDEQSSVFYDRLVDIRGSVTDGIAALNTELARYEKKLAEIENSSYTDDVGDFLKELGAEAGEGEAAAGGSAALTDGNGEGLAPLAESDAMVLATAARGDKTALLNTEIDHLESKMDASLTSLSEMVKAYNDREINELTIQQTASRYTAPRILSGSFIKLAIKTTGPIFMLGLMASLILIIIERWKEQKEANRKTE